MNETIGARIHRFRKEKGITQEELAASLNISSQAVSKWENDASCPDISLLPRLCCELGITTDTLLTGNEEQVRMLPKEQRKSLDDLTLRIRVNSSAGDKVRVNLPMSLVKIALEVGVDLIPAYGGDELTPLKNIDLSKIMELVERGAVGKLVEVESAAGDTVEVVVE